MKSSVRKFLKLNLSRQNVVHFEYNVTNSNRALQFIMSESGSELFGGTFVKSVEENKEVPVVRFDSRLLISVVQ